MVAKKRVGKKGGKRTMRKKSNWGKLKTQRGGYLEMAPFGGASDLQLDQPTMVQAQSYGQIQAIDEAQVLARQATQMGGSRRQSRRNRQSRKNRQSRRNRYRSQRGGMAPIGHELHTPAGAEANMNRQFVDEQFVNSSFSHYGAQH